MVAARLESVAVLKSQLVHWMQAVSRLSRLENLASTYAWNGVDPQVRQVIIDSLHTSIVGVREAGRQIEIQLEAGADYQRMRRALLALRQRYLSAETTVHFFTDALNSRTSSSVACLLRACDV